MTPGAVTRVDGQARQVIRQVVIHAAATDVFALLADPHRHPELDGSGTLRDVPVSGPHRLSHGASFRVAMTYRGFPYSITSTVTAFEADRLLEWRHPLGHHWRWELVEIEPGTVRVTETFDYRRHRAPWVLELVGQPGVNAVGITRTLQALAARFAR